MLQRAASNAYSWWRASHIRSKQSKWLDNNLEEMEDTVGNMLKLIEPNADSFAKRAELYFKRRPELIGYVEDAFRSYRALAERYDHISGELHKANHTIATSFPEHVQYAMLEEEGDGCPKALTPINPSKINKRTVEGLVNKKKEKKPPRKGKKKHKKALFNEETAREEINKLQKGILVLQTEKEFIKGSYESGIAKYWDIEKRIMEMHEQVCSLQDEFNASAVIEDDEARSLMTATVLKSCEDTIVKLQEQRRKSLEDAKKESARTKVAREKMETLKGVNSQTEMKSAEISQSQGITEANLSPEKIEQEFSSVDKAISELQSLCEKITDHFEKNPESSVIEIAEKIEDLANKVITMELTVSSQTLQVNRLISENDELEKFVNSVEEEKTNPTNDSNELSKKIKEAEEELSKVQAIERTIQNEVINFHENLSETWHSLDSISEMLDPHRSVENACIANASPEEEVPILNTETQRHCEDKKATEVLLDPHRSVENACIGDASPEEEVPILNIETQRDCEDNKATGVLLDPHRSVENPCIGEATPEEQVPILSTETQRNCEDKKATEVLLDPHRSVENACIGDASPEEEVPILNTETQRDCEDKKATQVDDIKEDMFYEADTTQEDDYCMGDPSQTDSGAQPKIAVVEKEPSTADLSINVTSNEQIIPDREEDSLKLQQLQSKEKILLAEYTSALENYEETKRKLSEVEKKNKEDLLEMTVLIGELKNEIAMKNEEIRLLRQPMASKNKISNDTPTPDTTSHEECQPCPEKLESTSKSAVVKKKLIPLSAKRPKRLTLEKSPARRGSSVELKQTKSSIAKGISGQWHDDSKISSPIEEKFRKEIDAQLDERLEFWLKFSTSFHHIQAFRDKYEDLQADLIKLKDKTQEANDTATTDEFGKSESAQLTTRLRQLKTELHVWLEQGALLKEDLQNRFSSLCAMQEEISSVLNTSSETGEVLFSPYQAARFQGEVMNMKKENNKIVSELKAGLDQVKGLHAEIEELLSALLFKKFEPLVPKDSSFDCLELSANRPNTVPLRDFLFGVKPKKMSILARIQQSKLKGGRLRI